MARSGESAPALFRWECGPSGEIAWVEGVPRGALIGRSLANTGEHHGVGHKISRAFRLRAPFREARLVVSGEGLASGDWKLSGVPAFNPADGRFAGYRGIAIREPQPDQEPAPERPPLDDDSLRELVHELKTPLNAIIGFAEIIDGQYLGPADHSYRERAAEIVSQARLLLSAIEDLDIAAQLRSAPETAGGSADLNAVLAALGPELSERAGRRGVVFELKPSRGQGECSLALPVLERLVRRFCEALIDAAAPRECVAIAADCDVGQCVLAASRPQALKGRIEQQLFGADDALATGFSLKLARGIAQAAGGDLRLTGEKLTLVLPRRRR
jgi:signal transduction histidine kinase